MSCRTIHSADGSVPPLALPPGALSHTDRAYDYDVDRDPPNVEPIEHQIPRFHRKFKADTPRLDLGEKADTR
ncbi:hypothetical protein [Haloquadratum walsbyi]|uniref:Uncharacterized protein n=1 Tax=Haloquadratum walsbyi J07HQW2 TaxID=1238425 RepID=U1NAL8_9EURY|nr:hypothetical protein [Haloquadratum walsbyi]ERG93658.1 MAG: hypothetical protein J07HQW2_00091 [Haloquadratum walsbyi J07HQW2]